MVAEQPQDVLYLRGDLIWNPTDLSAARPYGGTYMGSVVQANFSPGDAYQPIEAEEFGARQPVDVIWTGNTPILVGILRSYDATMLGQIFPNITTGSGGEPRIDGETFNGGNRPGEKLGDAKGGILLIAPTDENAHPHVIMWEAVPMIAEDASIAIGHNDEFGIGFSFTGLPNGNGRTYQMGLLTEISLSG